MNVDRFEIKIDATACTSMIEGMTSFKDRNTSDRWIYKNMKFEGGKIYGLIGEYGQGPMFLSYLLGGKVKFDDLKLYYNNTQVNRQGLEHISWNLEPNYEKYKKQL